MVGSVCKDKNVVHLGPSGSFGGMAAVMNNLVCDVNGHNLEVIQTHSDNSYIFMIKKWATANRILNKKIKNDKIKLAHVHVTHSLSWWRKRGFMKKCLNNQIPVIMHIHSGKFDLFCKSCFGIVGRSIKNMQKYDKLFKVVVLEERWLIALKKWIPEDSMVIRNYSRQEKIGERFKNDKYMKILMMARNDKIKGHDFAIKIMNDDLIKNKKFNMKIIGIEKDSMDQKIQDSGIEILGWVSEEEKLEIMRDSDLLISPSEYEGSSMSVIEAISQGIPCIVSEASSETIGIPELILKMDNPKEWIQKIITLSEPKNYKDIVEKIIKQSEKYDKNRIISQWNRLYDRMINESF